jgi:hypothetical protein
MSLLSPRRELRGNLYYLVRLDDAGDDFLLALLL